MLVSPAGCDGIIRQHKTACLRVTSLLVCRELLWIGSSAGVILNLPLASTASGSLTSTLSIAGKLTSSVLTTHLLTLSIAGQLTTPY